MTSSTGRGPLGLPRSFRDLPDDILIAYCIYGEARSESFGGKVAVAHVILNRARAKKWYGRNIKEVILKPKQFSCFNRNDPNYQVLLGLLRRDPYLQRPSHVALQESLRAAQAAYYGQIPDPTHGATHYHAAYVRPYWARKLIFCGRIGMHLFYKYRGE